MKNFLIFFALILFSVVALDSCSDAFTEKDAMEALQKINLQISVHDASNSDAPIAGATVSAIIDSSRVSVTTDDNGTALFQNVKIGGNINVYVSKEGYTNIFRSVYTTPDDYRQVVVGDDIYLYATDGPNIVTVKGQLTAETDLTNRERELLANVEVIAYNPNLDYGTSRYYTDSTDASGNYSIKMPADGNGNDIYVYFPTLELERTAGEAVNNIYSVETKPALYQASNYSPTNVLMVPSTLLQIEAPPAAGSGFQLGLKLLRNSLSNAVDNEYYDECIISGGTGYTGTESFIFAADPDGNSAELNVNVNGDGIITNVFFTNNGATYSSMPAIVTNPANGSGAQFDFRFRSRYNVYIANSGSGYLSFPQVGVDYGTTLDGTSKIRKEFYPNMDSYNPLGGGDLFNNAFITGGSIKVSDPTDGDTLFSTNYTYATPVFTYAEEDRLNAEFYAYTSAVNTADGSINNNFWYNTLGDGYDFSNPPAVTVVALAGYGTGATVRAEVDVNGMVSSNLIVMTKGKDYVRDINDYDDDGNSYENENAELYGFSSWSTGYGRHYDVLPGNTYIGDVFYGTGMVKNP